MTNGLLVLIGCAAAMLIAAVVINARSEDNSYAALVEEVRTMRGDLKSARTQYDGVTKVLDETSKSLNDAAKAMTSLNDKVTKLEDAQKLEDVRLHAAEEKVSRGLAIRTNKPIEVEIVRRPARPLLDRAGVTGK